MFFRQSARDAKGVRRTNTPFEEGVEEAIRNQPRGWNPRRPRTKLAGKLYQLVRQELGDARGLALYSSVGTSLDFFHGTDGFFRWRGAVVTLDLTVQRSKRRYSADVLIPHHMVANGGARRLARRIAHTLKRRAR